MGQATLDGMPMTNLHGGGRGYVPGKTPDDPKISATSATSAAAALPEPST